MNEHVRTFLRIFCIMGLVGFGVGTVLALSSAPVRPPIVVVFGVITAVMAVGLFLIRPRTEL